jgi:hypothetical protein
LLTKKEKLAILKYHAKVCHGVIRGRKECQRVPLDYSCFGVARHLEGSLFAIRALIDLLGLPSDFLPYRDSIIV